MSSSIFQSSRTRASRITLSTLVLLICRNSQMDDENFVIDWSINMGSHHLLHFGIRWCLGATHQACSRRTLGRLSRDRHLCCCGCRHKLADFPVDGRNNNTPAAREVSCRKLEKQFYRYLTNSSRSMAKRLLASWCCSSSFNRFLNVLRSEPSLFCHYKKYNWDFATQARERLLPSTCDLASWASESSKSLMTQQLNEKKTKKKKCAQVLEQVCTRCDAMWCDGMWCVRALLTQSADLLYVQRNRNKTRSVQQKLRAQQKKKQRGKNRQSSWERGRVKSQMRGQDPDFGGRGGRGGGNRHLVNTRNSEANRAWVQATEPISFFWGKSSLIKNSISILFIIIIISFLFPFLGFILGVLSLVLWVVVPISLFFIYLPIFHCTFGCYSMSLERIG